MSVLIIPPRQAHLPVVVRCIGADVGLAQGARLPDGVKTGLLADPGSRGDLIDHQPAGAPTSCGRRREDQDICPYNE